jgi:uncharacterized phage infection (PIP) family protein YhgE
MNIISDETISVTRLLMRLLSLSIIIRITAKSTAGIMSSAIVIATCFVFIVFTLVSSEIPPYLLEGCDWGLVFL